MRSWRGSASRKRSGSSGGRFVRDDLDDEVDAEHELPQRGARARVGRLEVPHDQLAVGEAAVPLALDLVGDVAVGRDRRSSSCTASNSARSPSAIQNTSGHQKSGRDTMPAPRAPRALVDLAVDRVGLAARDEAHPAGVGDRPREPRVPRVDRAAEPPRGRRRSRSACRSTLSDAVSTDAISPRAARVVVQRADHRREHAAPPVRRLHRDRRHAGDRNAARRPASSARTSTRACTRPSSPPSNAHRVRSSSARTQLSGRSGVRGGAPKPRRSTSSIAGSSASVIGRTSSGIRPFYSGGSARATGFRGSGPSPTGRAADRADVREAGEQQHQRDQEDARPAAAREDDGEQPAEHPRRAGTASRTARTPGRGPRRRRRAAGGCRTRGAPARRRGRDRDRRDDERGPPVRPRREHQRDARPDERAGEDPLLARPPAQQRREHAPDPGADRAHQQHEPEDPRRLVLRLQHERGEEREEADRAAQQAPSRCRPRRCSACAARRGRRPSPRARRARARGRPSAASMPEHEDHRRRRAAPTARARRCRIAGGERARPTMPPRMLMNARREFASTSSSLFLITPGTSALLVTLCVFESTSAANASGYSANAVDVRGHHQAEHGPARPSSPRTCRRRPPRVRSSSGPNTGATTRERRERQQRGTAAPSGAPGRSSR